MVLQLLGFIAVLCWAMAPRLGVKAIKLLVLLYAVGISATAALAYPQESNGSVSEKRYNLDC